MAALFVPWFGELPPPSIALAAFVALGVAASGLPCAALLGGVMWVAWRLRRPDLDSRQDIANEFD